MIMRLDPIDIVSHLVDAIKIIPIVQHPIF
jgi:hypothetical protein